MKNMGNPSSIFCGTEEMIQCLTPLFTLGTSNLGKTSIEIVQMEGKVHESARFPGFKYGATPKMVGGTQPTHGVFLLKMISTWGVKWGVPPFKETPIYQKDIQANTF